MKTVIAGLVAALALTGGAAGPAEAAPIRECGSFKLGYGMRVYDATTRNVQCWIARIQIHRTWARSGETGWTWWNRYMRMTCRARRYPGPSWDTRCTRGSRVIRYQHGY